MNLRKISTAIILLLIQQSASAQDPFFSQAHRSPLAINPALAGEGQTTSWRLQGNMRSQWWGGSTQPYKTGAVTVEHRIDMSQPGSALTLAGSFQSEVSNGGILKNNYASVGAAYRNALDRAGRHSLSVGLLGTFANRLLDPSGATMQNGFGSFGFMRGVAHDPVTVQKHRYWDVQTGIGYSYKGAQWSAHLGGALFHAARPEESAYNYGNGYRIPQRKVAEGTMGYINAEGAEWTLRANAQWQGQHEVQQVAVDYRFPIGEEAGRSLTFGLGSRIGDSFFPYVQLEWEKLSVGLSYDAVTGSVRRHYNQVRSAELTLAYGFGKKL
ncbi:PorP/SprF family type IX secretion system membrane protein [Pseudocnuella soli]|uniref:PorP/SprF family type IX secretion system membrane protein n=1 Tax=Pseudocnuella soli TaxID=2502779 RepID=UPI001053B332|nr:PorP/SprF family type IX secretion system membrane protein [Pseudocnuella soli]